MPRVNSIVTPTIFVKKKKHKKVKKEVKYREKCEKNYNADNKFIKCGRFYVICSDNQSNKCRSRTAYLTADFIKNVVGLICRFMRNITQRHKFKNYEYGVEQRKKDITEFKLFPPHVRYERKLY